MILSSAARIGHDEVAMANSQTVRRAGYAPNSTSVGRRGRHTRERILARAADLFVAEGYHDTSIEAVAKAVGGSRATVYQYFESKREIFLELAAACRPAVFEHARSLRRLGPDEDGLRELHRWLTDWAELHDKYAMVFLEFPGIGTIEQDAATEFGTASQAYTKIVAGKLRTAGITGIDPTDAAAALLRTCHMLNLNQFRNMFGLYDGSRVTVSLAIAMQRLIFPDTPAQVLALLSGGAGGLLGGAAAQTACDRVARVASSTAGFDEPDASAVSPVRQDILSAASVLFSEKGFYSVSMEDVAAAAEVSRATLYRHFSTKVALLDELSSWSTLESAHLSSELLEIAARRRTDALRAWLARYVHFHRAYSGVIRAWYDGAIARQISGDSVARGMRTLYAAAQAFLTERGLPPGMDSEVAAAIFLAVLGRLSEYSTKQRPAEKDYGAAGFMLLVLQRAILANMSTSGRLSSSDGRAANGRPHGD